MESASTTAVANASRTLASAEVTDIAPLLFQPFPLAGRPMQRHSGFRVPVIKDS